MTRIRFVSRDNCYECRTVHPVTDWFEISTEDYKKLLEYKRYSTDIWEIEILYDPEKIICSLKDDYEKALLTIKAKEKAAAKRKATLEAKALERKKKQYDLDS